MVITSTPKDEIAWPKRYCGDLVHAGLIGERVGAYLFADSVFGASV
jgi:hypothetical protein